MVFVIDNNTREIINQLISYAEKNVYSMDDLLDVKNGALPPAGDDPNFCIDIPVGYHAVFTIEEQPPGPIKHLSVSVNRPGQLPHPAVVIEIMKAFNFKYSLQECIVADEEFSPGHKAINVLDHPRKNKK